MELNIGSIRPEEAVHSDKIREYLNTMYEGSRCIPPKVSRTLDKMLDQVSKGKVVLIKVLEPDS